MRLQSFSNWIHSKMKNTPTPIPADSKACYTNDPTSNPSCAKRDRSQAPTNKSTDTREDYLNAPVSFADWKDALLCSGLLEQDRKSYEITINWFLSYCRRSRSPATRRAANAFYETVKRERDPKPFQLTQWKNALAWFFRSADRDPGQPLIPGELVASNPRPREGEGWFGSLVAEIRRRRYSHNTEKSYLMWARALQRHAGRDLDVLGREDVRGFLDHLAVKQRVSASTQRQALNAIVFLFHQALGRPLGDFSDYLRARPRTQLPTVLTREELDALFSKLAEPFRSMAKLQYGSGLRLSELCSLRIKDIDFGNWKVIVRGGKGSKDRAAPLPRSLAKTLRSHIENIRATHDVDRAAGVPGVYIPESLERKFRNAGRQWGWFWLWPGNRLSVDPRSGIRRRHYVIPRFYQGKISKAAKDAEIPKRVTSHVLRHSFATHLLENGMDVRRLQDLMGHVNIKTTQTYLHVMRPKEGETESPLDF